MNPRIKPQKPRKKVLGAYLLLAVVPVLLVAGVLWQVLHRPAVSSFQPVVLFSDDFSTASPGAQLANDRGWENVALQLHPDSKSKWYYSLRQLYHESHIPADYTDDPKGFLDSVVATGNLSWSDYMLKARVEPLDEDGVGLVFRYQDSQNYYAFTMVKNKKAGGPFVALVKKVHGEFTTIAKSLSGGEGGGDYHIGTWYRLKVVARGDNLEAYVNGDSVLHARDQTFVSGKVGLFCWEQSSAFFDVVLVTQLE
jgi:hypothetical protein